MRRLAVGFVIGWLCLLGSSNAIAAENVIPLSEASRKALAPLGEGVVGEAVPAKPIEDPAQFLGLRSGTMNYQVVGASGDKAKYYETFEKVPKTERGATWKRTHPDFVDHFTLTPDGTLNIATELDTQFGYLVHLDPEPHLLVAGLKPGQTVKVDSKIKVYKAKDPTKEVYHGTLSTALTYEGAYKVKTPAGTFDAALIRADRKVHVGPADVEDMWYAFIAEGVGKVAGVEALHISAIMIYHSNKQTPVLLVEQPAAAP